MMRRLFIPTVTAVATLALCVARPAAADVLFDFNALADGGNSANIQTYMNGQLTIQLGAGKTVVVSGAGVEKDYNGDNHVVGPTSGRSVTSLTLGTSDGNVQHGGAPDAFIYNSNDVKFTLTFNFAIYGVSFDYEIFPNASCGNPKSYQGESNVDCSVLPDFTLKAGNGGPTVSYLHTNSVDPFTTAINGYQNSPDSGTGSKEKAAQWLGMSGYVALPGVTVLEFYDWPERIAIDNLRLNVPEPTSLALLGAGLVGFVARRRSKRA